MNIAGKVRLTYPDLDRALKMIAGLPLGMTHSASGANVADFPQGAGFTGDPIDEPGPD